MRQYPWRLKLVHEGGRCIRLERKGRFFVFEPGGASDEVGILLGGDSERVSGLVSMAQDGRGEVVLSDEVADELPPLNGITVHRFPTTVDGVAFESMNYSPLLQPDRSSGILRMRRAIKSPRKAAKRWRDNGGRTASSPLTSVVQLTFPDGSRLLHLDLSLHQETSDQWVQEAQGRFRGADWLICGVEYGQDEAVLTHLKGFEPKLVMLTDLVNEQRQAQGLPVNLLTPTVDALIGKGLSAHPFPPKSSFRFEQ